MESNILILFILICYVHIVKLITSKTPSTKLYRYYLKNIKRIIFNASDIFLKADYIDMFAFIDI